MARKTTLQRAQQHKTLVTHDQPKSPVSEQYRTLRTNLQFSSVDNELSTMIVTSTTQSEGKSLTASNLAIAFAQQGKKVLLVDADMRRPTVHYSFRISNTFGLSNLLVGDHTLEQLVHDSKVDNLDLLTCGPIPPNPSELLASSRMRELIGIAKQSYDLVIFDTPPVLAVTDPQILANETDGALLVIRSKKTEKDAAKRAKELLEQANANLLGAVLNDKDIKDSNYLYYYN
ncbi:CpsD/CapB family tyrosine-protein kinase [Alkalibacillus haloalkaliphilus]|uniref:CpsD/CapB family tyrosine-protein kinase n=1 Tax=Alkalibacillus haloalkaliphilus TaxID=94136 RepID=UPI0029368261|nr:CpsD/CapB family tyrosine-protein kinase [Alkalibacillus haloalkaliphilus]MDV2582154.1 CpsD/CapB family tyrosine-protein kinase [Alkalibacillus haloalkaliphilus]